MDGSRFEVPVPVPERSGRVAPGPVAMARGGRSLWLIDESALGRDSLARAMRLADPALDIAHAASPADCAIGRDPPDIVVLHLHAERVSGGMAHAAIAAVREQAPGAPILAVGDLEDSEQVLAALRAGLRGYFPTSLGVGVLCAAIGLVLAGGTFIPDSAILSRDSRNGTIGLRLMARAPDPHGLTPREADVLRALRRGQPNKAIARDLAMSEGTVKVHLRNIMKKLSARNRTQLVSLALNALEAGLPGAPPLVSSTFGSE